MNWTNLLSHYRWGSRPNPSPLKGYRPPWQTDFDRITFGSAFRRLQDKTQVFPLSSSDYVRTRLTHSMEVACVARTLGNRVGYEIRDKGLPENIHPLEIGMITAAAALAHDIGNPPFGHSGEDSIRCWFKNSPTVKLHKDSGAFTKEQCADFENFEGNAQGFRVLTKLQMYKKEGGLRLTDATLGAFTKYSAEVWLGDKPSERPLERKKFGFFQDDRNDFQSIAERLGLIERNGSRKCWARHPLSFLVEAADDICYRLVDFEDAVQQKLIDFEIVKNKLIEAAEAKGDGTLLSAISAEEKREQINHLRARAIGKAIEHCTAKFAELHDDILMGSLDADLISQTACSSVFEEIKALQQKHVYTDQRVLRVEAAGFRVVGGLLEAFFQAASNVVESGGRKHATAENRKIYDLLSEEYRGPMNEEPYARLLRVTDYVCGMTDGYALDLYRNIAGISIP